MTSLLFVEIPNLKAHTSVSFQMEDFSFVFVEILWLKKTFHATFELPNENILALLTFSKLQKSVLLINSIQTERYFTLFPFFKPQKSVLLIKAPNTLLFSFKQRDIHFISFLQASKERFIDKSTKYFTFFFQTERYLLYSLSPSLKRAFSW